MSEEFSGQTTRSGRGWAPAATDVAAARVTATWSSSTARRSALKSRPGSGHVALHGHEPGRVPVRRRGHDQRDQQQRTGERPDRYGPAQTADRAPSATQRDAPSGAHPAQPAHRGGPHGPDQRDTEGHRRGTAERGEVHQGRVGLAERQPRPGEPAERRAVAQRLLPHPQQGDRRRAHPWRTGQRRCALEQRGRATRPGRCRATPAQRAPATASCRRRSPTRRAPAGRTPAR